MVLERGVIHSTAAIGGQVEEILVAAGDRLEKGQVVARLRPDGLTRDLGRARERRRVVLAAYHNLRRLADERDRLSAAAARALDQECATRRRELDELDHDIHRLARDLERHVDVVWPSAGRVLGLTVREGDTVSPGTVIATGEADSDEVVALLFVPSSRTQQVPLGMPVRLLPKAVPNDGPLSGIVRSVEEVPTTLPRLLRVLDDHAFVRELLDHGPVNQVHVSVRRHVPRQGSTLRPNRALPSRLKVTGWITIREDRPLSFLLARMRGASSS